MTIIIIMLILLLVSCNDRKDNESFEVTFILNNGENNIILKLEDNSLLLPQEPIKLGFKFTGWNIDEDSQETFNEDEIISNNLTLYADWEEIEPIDIDIEKTYSAKTSKNDVSVFNFSPKYTSHYTISVDSSEEVFCKINGEDIQGDNYQFINRFNCLNDNDKPYEIIIYSESDETNDFIIKASSTIENVLLASFEEYIIKADMAETLPKVIKNSNESIYVADLLNMNEYTDTMQSNGHHLSPSFTNLNKKEVYILFKNISDNEQVAGDIVFSEIEEITTNSFTIERQENTVFRKFIPTESGMYKFDRTGSGGLLSAFFLDENMRTILSGTIGGTYNYEEVAMQAGTVYYMGITLTETAHFEVLFMEDPFKWIINGNEIEGRLVYLERGETYQIGVYFEEELYDNIHTYSYIYNEENDYYSYSQYKFRLVGNEITILEDDPNVYKSENGFAIMVLGQGYILGGFLQIIPIE